MNTQPGHFDNLAAAYEAMIDWPKRLANETPFYRSWFERAGVRGVVDVASGAGHHAALFHDWGLRVEGADISPAMIELARLRFGESADLRWVVRGFDAAVGCETPFDAAICVGNSLALAPDRAVAARAIEQMLAAVRSGGIAIVHVMNLWRLPDGPVVWQKCQRAMLPQGESLILKGVHRCGQRGFVEMAVVGLGGGASVSSPAAGVAPSSNSALPMQTESVPLLGLEAADCEAIARNAGAAETHVFGGYQEQLYDRATSVDWILVARR